MKLKKVKKTKIAAANFEEFDGEKNDNKGNYGFFHSVYKKIKEAEGPRQAAENLPTKSPVMLK